MVMMALLVWQAPLSQSNHSAVEFHSTVTALRWAAFWTLAPCPMRYRRCQRVGADCPAAWGMPEVHGEGIRSERRFGREAVLCPKRLFGRFCRLAVPAMRDSAVEWTR